MKSLPLIYGIYILCLSCIPCSDINVCANSAISIDISAPVHDEHDHDQDLCSPFCVCICCGMSITSTPANPTPAAIPGFTQNTYSEYRMHFIHEVSSNIWQPPRLG